MVSVYDIPVQCQSCESVVSVDPPASRRKYGLGFAAVLGVIGLFFGLSVGIATAGFGMAATPFTLVIGLYAGYRIGAWSARKKDGIDCPECHSHVVGA